MKAFLHLASPIATLIGLVLSTWGSYRLVLYYHPYKGLEFWKSLASITGFALTIRFGRLARKVNLEAELARNKREHRVDSLSGIYLIFFGFVLQVFGATCWVVDSKMDLNAEPAISRPAEHHLPVSNK